MKVFLALASILALALGRPDGLLDGNDGHVSVTQSSEGAYKFIVQLKDSFRTEERLPDGTILGEYSVPDPNGILRIIKYSAGRDGFRVLEGALPVAPVVEPLPSVDLPLVVEDTPEVKAAREEFLAIHSAEAARTVL